MAVKSCCLPSGLTGELTASNTSFINEEQLRLLWGQHLTHTHTLSLLNYETSFCAVVVVVTLSHCVKVEECLNVTEQTGCK